MTARLAGKVAIVTGGGQGIGRAVVSLFAQEGACVVVADIDETAAAQSAAAAGPPERVLPQYLDAGDEDSWRALLARTLQVFGSVQIIVNNAAARTPLTLEQTTLALWQENQRVTAAGVFLGTKLGGEFISGAGAIVNVASIAAFVGLAQSLPYSAAKGAVRALSRSAALHFAKQRRNIRVNVVAPGATWTDAIARQAQQLASQTGVSRDAVVQQLTADVPLQRMAEPREIAAAILFLASDDASFITGSELLVDGGQTAA